MIVLILLAMLILNLYLLKKLKYNDSLISKIAIACAGVSLTMVIVVFAYSIIALVTVHLPTRRETEFYKYQQRYEVITHALQDDSNNVAILVDDIADYNSDVLSGRRKQDNFWLGAFEYDFYYDLDLIELGEKANEEV